MKMKGTITMSEFGKRLKMIREENELTLAQLAEKLNTTKSNLSRYENGKVDPTLDVVIDIANYFNVTLDWMSGTSDLNVRVETLNSEQHKKDMNARYGAYLKAFDKIVDAKISPDKLNQIIDILNK
jgi:transcriptional regulator with XRE-family HTH domain